MMKDGSEQQARISLHNLQLGYKQKEGDVAIASQLNETLMPGKVTCLVGPNGAGKSTLLKTIAGFLKPLSGAVMLNGTAIQDIPQKEMSKLISVVLTERGHFTSTNVMELVRLGRTPYTGFFGRLADNDKEIVDRALEATGITHLAKRNVNSLSDGERQKAMIAKSLAQDTPLIILDEPTAFLDFPGKVEIMQLLEKLTKFEGKTVLMSTHDLDIAFATTDRLWLLDKKSGLTSGTVEELGANGDIGRYFNHKGLHYNAQEKRFEININ